MNRVDTHQQRLHDEFSAVEREIESHNQQVEELNKRLAGLKRAIELFESDHLAITELLRTTSHNGGGFNGRAVAIVSAAAVPAVPKRRGRPPLVRVEAAPKSLAKSRGPRAKRDGGIKRVDMISTALKRHPGLSVRELIAAVGKEFGWECTESNITGHLYTNPKRFTHTKADRANKQPIKWSLK